MFNIEKYEDTQNKLNNYEDKIRVLEELKRDIEDLILNTQENCNHDLILCYKKEEHKISDLKVCNCLFCGRYFKLNKNLDIFTEEKINYSKIIDVTDKVSESSQNTTKSGESILVLKAKEKIKVMINWAKRNNQKLDLDLVKNVLLNTMIDYDEELKKERKRLTKEKK